METRPQFFTKQWTTEPFSDAPFMPNRYTHLFPIHLSAWMLPTGFRMCWRHQIQNEKQSLAIWALNILSLKCVQLIIGWKELANHRIPNFIVGLTPSAEISTQIQLLTEIKSRQSASVPLKTHAWFHCNCFRVCCTNEVKFANQNGGSAATFQTHHPGNYFKKRSKTKTSIQRLRTYRCKSGRFNWLKTRLELQHEVGNPPSAQWIIEPDPTQPCHLTVWPAARQRNKPAAVEIKMASSPQDL